MGKSVVEAHQLLYHYTTASGLQGIVESQQLRATNIAYLNDAEEHTGFFERRLPHLLEESIRVAVADLALTDSGRRQIEDFGGAEKAIEDLKSSLIKSLRSTTLKFNNPYITSFCSALSQQAQDDGLLSQWRGYGSDGGYAIVFEANGLQKLLDEESKSYQYQFLGWGDVEYYDQDSDQKAAHPETIEWEKIIQKGIYDFILTQKEESFNPLHTPITSLSCSHKHRGFREEAEVRIMVVPANNLVFQVAQKSGDKRPKKPIHFVMKNGVLVPYIMLFGRQSNGNITKLPIKKVMVGPHPERVKRKKAVESLLEQYEIEAKVTVSDIPYLGR